MLDNVNFTSYAVVDGEKKYFKDQYGREESENRDSVLQAQIGDLSELETGSQSSLVDAINEARIVQDGVVSFDKLNNSLKQLLIQLNNKGISADDDGEGNVTVVFEVK